MSQIKSLTDAEISDEAAKDAKDRLEQARLLLDLMRESCRPSPYFHTPKKEEKL